MMCETDFRWEMASIKPNWKERWIIQGFPKRTKLVIFALMATFPRKFYLQVASFMRRIMLLNVKLDVKGSV